jgi:hypothetical protein
MKKLINANYNISMSIALNLSGKYDKSVTFHCYWNGVLNEKHLYSILSCYYFNVHNNKHKIILWLENNIPNQYNSEIQKYAEIKQFLYNEEKKNTNFISENYTCIFPSLPLYSDLVRTLLLYNYGGVWFDLDCFFMRSFDPLFCNYGNEICVYEWEYQNYPNNAIYISLHKKCEKMKKNMEYIMNNFSGWGFQDSGLIYDLPLDLLVLPCSWFNVSWIMNPLNIRTEQFISYTDQSYNFDNFYKGAFCYHWHNKWDLPVHDKSIMSQLVNIIYTNLQIENTNKEYKT